MLDSIGSLTLPSTLIDFLFLGNGSSISLFHVEYVIELSYYSGLGHGGIEKLWQGLEYAYASTSGLGVDIWHNLPRRLQEDEDLDSDMDGELND